MKLLAFFFALFPVFFFFPDQSVCQDTPAPASNHRYLIKISTGQCRLWLFQQGGNQSQLVREYPVGTVKIGLKRYPLGKGRVTDIDFAPIWRPTAYTRWYFAAKKGIFLPSTVEFGHKLNYMGKFRISLSHNVPSKGQVYRIHGVRSGEEGYVGTRISGGCIRMLNNDGLELARIISVGTPVEIIP